MLIYFANIRLKSVFRKQKECKRCNPAVYDRWRKQATGMPFAVNFATKIKKTRKDFVMSGIMRTFASHYELKASYQRRKFISKF